MPQEHLTPITDVLLEQDQLLVVAIPRTDGAYDAFSFQITRTAPINKEITEIQDIAAGGTVAADQLREDGHDDQQTGLSGDNVFRLIEDEDEKRIYHFGQHWTPNDLQIYFENPNGELPQGLTRQTAVAEGDDEGWTAWSDDTQFTDKIPSTALETIILPGVTPFIGFENTSDTVSQPTAFFTGRAYKVTPLNNVDLDLAVRVAVGLNVQRTLKKLGGLEPFNVSTPESWGDEISLTATELAKILRTKVTSDTPQEVFEDIMQSQR